MSRNLSESVKRRIAGKQYFKCANSSKKNLYGLEGYKCPLWKIKGIKQGSFGESCYEIDHILEHNESHDDSEKNLQALCLICHRVKTSRYATKRCKQKRSKTLKKSVPVKKPTLQEKHKPIFKKNLKSVKKAKPLKKSIAIKKALQCKDKPIFKKNSKSVKKPKSSKQYVKYTCARCKDEFNRKGHYEKHLTRKKPCIKRDVSTKKIKDYICKGCGANLSRTDKLHSHEKICDEYQTRIKGVPASKHKSQILFPFKTPHGCIPIEIERKLFNPEKNPFISLFEHCYCNLRDSRYLNIYYSSSSDKDTHGFIYIQGGWQRKKLQSIIDETLLILISDLNNYLNYAGNSMEEKNRIYLIDCINAISKKNVLLNNSKVRDLHIKIRELLIDSEFITKFHYESNSDSNKCIEK